MLVYHGKKAQLRAQAMQLASVLAGTRSDNSGIARAFLLCIGYAALSDIREAFVTKARGGTDAIGIKWAPLQPATIANRRVGKNDIDAAQAWYKARQKALKQVQAEFARQEGDLYERFLLSMDGAAARRRARQIASARATEATGMTKLQALGYRQVEILRDTGVLLNSLTPGVIHGTGVNLQYIPPLGEGRDDQIFEIGEGEITLGTKCAYALAHQEGVLERHLPRRQFLPTDSDTIPQSWWDNWLDAGQQALQAAAALYFDPRRAA